MSLSLPELPFPVDALEPCISAKTVGFHYGRHHAGYVARTNQLLAQSDLNGLDLESLVRSAYERGETALFNNAAQVWNHTFYWHSLHPEGGGRPHGTIASLIEKDFGGDAPFLDQLQAAATTCFGSGWAWVVLDSGRLDIVQTANADNPLVRGQVPLLAIDVWEHAYYLDHQDLRASYVRGILDHLINWEYANENLESVPHLLNIGAASPSTADEAAALISPD